MNTPDTRTRLFDASYSLMLAKGYPATSVAEICDRAEVSKGSFYHFFASKQQLAMEMLKHHMAGAQATIEHGLDRTGADEEDFAIRYVQHVEQVSEDIWRDGCLIGSFALELSETHPELRAQISEVFRGLADHLEKIFTPLCRANPGPDAPSPRELAEQMISVIEGGVVLSRAHNDRRFVPQALRCFRRYLNTLRQR